MRAAVALRSNAVLAASIGLALVYTTIFGAPRPAVAAQAATAPTISESARQIPVAREVDVVVVGGSTGAVAAAVTAAEAGAKVFLAAPRPYLGDDMTATLRLWRNADERPTTELARKVFEDPVRGGFGRDADALNFTYSVDPPAANRHKDTVPPMRLADGEWNDPVRHSLEHTGDATVIADLGRTQRIEEVRLRAYYRSGSDAFRVGAMEVATSDDGRQWSKPASVPNDLYEPVTTLSLPLGRSARYVRVRVSKSENVARMLLGELEVIGPPRPRPASGPQPLPRPMHVKKTLDDALLAAKVDYLYGCYATDVVRDPAGRLAGVVMANRAGRQAVLAKVVIDATDRGLVARLAGARFSPFPAGKQTLKRVVIGGPVIEGPDMSARTIEPAFQGRYPNPAGTSTGEFQVIEYTLNLDVAEDTPGAWARADQLARSLTYHAEQQFTSDVVFQIPPDHVMGAASASSSWQGIDALPLDVFRPQGIAGLILLSGAADISRAAAEQLLRPATLMAMGEKIGLAAAEEAAALPRPSEATVAPAGDRSVAESTGDVGEFLAGPRPVDQLRTITQPRQALPVLGQYDVVVVGGGTAGAPAAIGAARQGAKTLVIEYLSGLGGVGTTGAISKYYWGNRVGFAATVEEGLASWVIEQRMEWWRRNLLEAGADIWFGSIGCGAYTEGKQVRGVVVATPQGRGVVLAKVVLDTTGNADIAAAAGADCLYTDETELAMQGTGLPPRQLGESYTNTDFTITDETDVVDVWHVFVYAKEKYPKAFDQGQLIDTRERRRIVGDFTMDPLDQINGRTYPDTVLVTYSNFDSHGYTIHPYFELEHPHKTGFRINVPYRCLLPASFEGLLVGGLGMSAHRDAVPMTRMQPDLQNQGYAMGVAAAMAVEAGCGLRQIDIRRLQAHLIEVGNLPESVLTDKDSYPLPQAQIEAAVASVPQQYKGVAAILTQPEVAKPLLRAAYRKAQGEAKLAYAHVLAVLGDNTGVDTLMAAIDAEKNWDQGWNYRGGGQFGWAMSPLDARIVALGRSGDSRTLPVIFRKLEQLTAESEFSHHRAVGLALELIGDRGAAMPLAGLLTRPGVAGFVHRSIDDAKLREVPGGTAAVQTRSDSIRELFLARALYRCGDYGGLGERTLEAYTNDLRGHLARHAQAVLAEGQAQELPANGRSNR